MINILSLGASVDILNTTVIQQAIDQVAEAGGGRVTIPSGQFLTGPLCLKSNVELYLSPGAVLKFTDDPAQYSAILSSWEGVPKKVYAACIYAQHAENIAVTGLGKLDGSGPNWWRIFREEHETLEYPRPKLLGFDHCRRVTIRDIQLVDSPSWTIHPNHCQDVTIDHVVICNPADSPNTDGIDPESCHNVHISNCHIDVGDDCIAIKAGTEDAVNKVPCQNITITNCTMVHGHGGVVLGSEMSGGIRNVTISNCVFQQTDRGIRLKTRRGRGGMIEDVRVTNLIMDQVLCPFVINLYYFCGPRGKDPYVWDKEVYPIDERTPQVRRVHFSSITARNVHASAGFIYGLAEQAVQDISFDHVDISMAKDAKAGVPAMMTGLEPMRQQGFYVRFGKHISFQQITIDHHEGPAIMIEDSEDIEIKRMRSTELDKKNVSIIEGT
ncbi:hypothetical protein IGJ48_002809 [Enterococcus pernyi]